jgi:hypothetical protein
MRLLQALAAVGITLFIIFSAPWAALPIVVGILTYVIIQGWLERGISEGRITRWINKHFPGALERDQ